MRIAAQAEAEAQVIRIKTVAAANAESIQKVNEAIQAGGESYFRYRQIEMLPQIAPQIVRALAAARMVTITGDGRGAADATTGQISGVIQTILAAQLVGRSGILDAAAPHVSADGDTPPAAPTAPVAAPVVAAPVAAPSGNGGGLGYPASVPPNPVRPRGR